MPSKENKRRKKRTLPLTAAASHQTKPSPIVVCLAASVAMLRKSERRNLEASEKPKQ